MFRFAVFGDEFAFAAAGFAQHGEQRAGDVGGRVALF
jgi:hypothetical protein